MKASRTGLILVLLSLLIASVVLTGCRPEGAGDDVMPPPDGSDSAADDSSTIRIIGSTTVLPISDAWATAYHQANQGVNINVSGGGSGNGIKAIIDGTADIGQSSRGIKESEIQLAEQNGVDPVEHTVAYDGIAPIVHPDNPVQSLSIEQLSDIYSGEIGKWSEVGVSGMANDNIVIVSRDSASGTYESWKEIVIQMEGADEDRDYAPAALKKNSNKDVRQTVADTRSAIGYVGIGYIDDSIKVVPVVPLDGDEAVMPTNDTVQDESYPVSRAMYMYTDGEPTGNVADFLEWGLSEDGQALVEEQGFVPVE